jgi:hypothetical protein
MSFILVIAVGLVICAVIVGCIMAMASSGGKGNGD